MSSDESESETLLHENAFKHDTLHTLPVKSKERYIAVYENFLMWQKSNNLNSFSEKIVLQYFVEMAPKYKPSTLWAMYSMIKCNLKCNHNINMDNYQRVSAYLKTLSKGYKTKVKGLTIENVEKFIDEAPDEKYLATKVALIFGVAGGLRRQQLCEVTTSDIENHGALFLVHKPCTNKKFGGSFIIEGKHYNVVKKYQSLRTDKSPSNRFFQQFRDGKCRGQVIGVNRFGMMPKEIAVFLNLPDANLYTGHSFRTVSRHVDVRIRDKPEWWETVSINDSNSSSLQPEPPSLSSRMQPELPSLSSRTKPEPPSLSSRTKPEAPSLRPSNRQEQMRPSIRQDQKQNRGCQCRFCGDFKECSPVLQKPYLMGNKVSLALNHLRVELDFSIDSLPKTVCRECDAKLLETFEFIKQVNTAQFSLVAVTQDMSVNNLAHTYTSNDFEFNAQIVKAEFDSDESENQVIEDSLTLGETVYLKETHKRKKKSDDKTKKKRKVKDKEVTQNTELIIDIKEEIVDLDTNDELSDDLNDTGTDLKPDEEELAESEFIYLEENNVVNEKVKGKLKSTGRQCND